MHAALRGALSTVGQGSRRDLSLKRATTNTARCALVTDCDGCVVCFAEVKGQGLIIFAKYELLESCGLTSLLNVHASVM